MFGLKCVKSFKKRFDHFRKTFKFVSARCVRFNAIVHQQFPKQTNGHFHRFCDPIVEDRDLQEPI